MEYTHVSFSDESNWKSGRYRSIGMLSASRLDALWLHREVSRLLSECQVKELNWNKIRTAKHRFAAEKIIDSCASVLSDGRLRIDVLTWDSQDPRHKAPGAEAHLQVMYSHLFRNVMSHRWPSDRTWRHVPDEHSGAAWDESLGASIKGKFRIAEITDSSSQEMCLAQVADLFAGMGAFSRESFNDYRAWKRNAGYASTLFEATARPDPAPGLLERYQVLSHFEEKLSELAFPVALDQTGGLRTLDPSIPVDYWWYEAQSRFDPARAKYAGDRL